MVRSAEEDMSRRHALWALGALGSSLVLHGICYASLASVPRPVHKEPVRSLVTFEVPEPKPLPPPPPAEEQDTPPEPEAPRVHQQAPKNPAPAPTPAQLPPAQPAPPPTPAALDLTGVTLT